MSFTGKKYKQISKTRKVKCRVKTCQIILYENSYPDHLKRLHPNENPHDRRTYGQKQLFAFCSQPDNNRNRNQCEDDECEETEKGEGLETELEKSDDMEVGQSDENQPQKGQGDFRRVEKPTSTCRSRSPHGLGVTRNVYRATLDECTLSSEEDSDIKEERDIKQMYEQEFRDEL